MWVGDQRNVSAALTDTHYIGSWVGFRAGLDGCGKSVPHRDSIPRPSSP